MKSIGKSTKIDPLWPRDFKANLIWRMGSSSLGFPTDQLTVLNVGVSNILLGKTILDQLNQSILLDIPWEEIRELRVSFRKKGKFKSEKSTVVDAKNVAVYLKTDSILFEPFNNKISTKTFYRSPKDISELKIFDEENIGMELKLAWDKCKFLD